MTSKTTKSTATITYTTRGAVRGCCGHRHRSLRAAARCCYRDLLDCERQGGYSDRMVERLDGEPLTDEEHEVAWAISCGRTY